MSRNSSPSPSCLFFFFNDTATTEIYTLSLHDALPILDRRIAERRTFPAIDVQRSGTRKEEILLSKEELNKVYLLRNFLADMPPVEAIEFLLERLKRTKTNNEFFATMA